MVGGYTANKNLYQTALLGGGGSGSTKIKKPTTGGTYANGIAGLTQTTPTVKMPNITSQLNSGVVRPVYADGLGYGGGYAGGITKEGVISGGGAVNTTFNSGNKVIKGGLGVTKLPNAGSAQIKYGDNISSFIKLPSAKDNITTPVMTAQKTGATTTPTQGSSTETEKKTPATYEEYLEQQRELLDKRKTEADRQAEAAKERAAVDAQASYAQNMASYGTNAENLAQMGLQGGGYSDYLNAQAYAQKRADVQQANVTEQAAKAQNNATYEDALSELNRGDIEHREKEKETEAQKKDSVYASLWEKAIDPNSNLTAENIAAMGKEYGLDDAKITELQNIVATSRKDKNSNMYGSLLELANSGSMSAEQVAKIAVDKGLDADQIKGLMDAANKYKENIYKTNYSGFMGSIEDGKITKNVLDTALKNDTITKAQYDDLLNKFQTSYYDTYAEEIATNFAAVNTDTVDKSLQRGEITKAQYDDIKKKYNESVASAITSATLFYDSGVKLDEKNAKALAEKIKNSGWLSDENKSKIDTFLADDYKEEDDGGGCYAKGTLITVADGSLVPVEELKEGDNILVFNHYTGEVDIAPVLYMYYEGKKEYDVLKLHFGEAADIEVLYGHGFFDVDLNKYVLIKSSNVQDYIGHRFYNIERTDSGDVMNIVALTGYENYKRETECYCAVSTKHLNCVANGILTIADDQNRPPQSVIGFCNLFELDENHKIDAAKMAADIETYGIFSYEDFCQMVPDHIDISDLFFGIGGEYIKIAFGKGLMSMERLSVYIGIGADHRSEQNDD